MTIVSSLYMGKRLILSFNSFLRLEGSCPMENVMMIASFKPMVEKKVNLFSNIQRTDKPVNCLRNTLLLDHGKGLTI